jgi:hypothetical protein
MSVVYLFKAQSVTVNDSTNISKVKKYLLPQIIEHKKTHAGRYPVLAWDMHTITLNRLRDSKPSLS